MKLRENLKNEQRNEDTMKKNDRLTYSRMGLSDLYISNIGLGGQSISGRFCNNQDELSMKTMFILPQATAPAMEKSWLGVR